MNSLAILVLQALKRGTHADDLYLFRGKRSNVVEILWHDGVGMSLYGKRLERATFIWASPAVGTVAIILALNWRSPVRSWRPEAAG